MTKNKALNNIPKIHTIRRGIAEEIFHLVFSGKDKYFRKTKVKEIEDWLAKENFLINETPTELAKEWQEYTRESNSFNSP